jgi:M6 family metalloprotease-like protein
MSAPGQLAPLSSFGYQHMNVNGQLALGAHPILVIFVNFQGQTPLPHTFSYYSNLVFSTSETPTMNGYFQANSDGRFSLTGGAILLNLPASQSFTVYSNLYAPFTRDEVWASNIIAQAMISGQFNFAAYDTAHTGHITPQQLSITIVTSDTGETGFGGSRPVPPNGVGKVTVPGLTYDWGYGPNDSFPNVAIIGESPSFVVWCEETQETMGALDIYGDQGWSYRLSTQSSYSPTYFGIYYLDPWNRMSLGWCSPRVESLTAGGKITIAAEQAGDPTAPVILYDPAHGTSEYWILEYRTQTSPYGSGYDATVAGNGLAVWHIQQDSSHNLITTVSNKVTGGRQQTDWNEGPPNLTWGSSSLWGSDSVTPNLTFLNGDTNALNSTPTLTHLHVMPFSQGDGSITVEWLSTEDTWVDFGYSGSTQNGTFNNPYNTIAAGVNACSYGGTLHIKAGSTPAAITMTKPMKVVAYGGPATIGN